MAANLHKAIFRLTLHPIMVMLLMDIILDAPSRLMILPKEVMLPLKTKGSWHTRGMNEDGRAPTLAPRQAPDSVRGHPAAAE